MKINLSNLILIILITTTFSCSNDDDSAALEQQVQSYFNLAVDNSWTYNNQVSNLNQPSEESQETLSVDELITENGIDQYQLETTDIGAFGSMTSFLTSGLLYESEDGAVLTYSGTLDLPIMEDLPALDIEMQNMKLYDQHSAAGTTLFIKEAAMTEVINEIPLTISYHISSVYGGNIGSMTVNGTTYENVIENEIKITGEVTADFTITEVTVLEGQDIFTTTNYFAPQIGLIKSEAEMQAIFEDLSSFNLPLEDIHVITDQELIDFSLQAN